MTTLLAKGEPVLRPRKGEAFEDMYLFEMLARMQEGGWHCHTYDKAQEKERLKLLKADPDAALRIPSSRNEFAPGSAKITEVKRLVEIIGWEATCYVKEHRCSGLCRRTLSFSARGGKTATEVQLKAWCMLGFLTLYRLAKSTGMSP